MSYERKRRTVTTRTTTAGSSYGASGNRSALGYWLPLAITVTAATVGLVAWVWSERSDDEDTIADSDNERKRPSGAVAGYTNISGGLPPGPGPTGSQPPQAPGMPLPGPPVEGGFQGPPQTDTYQVNRSVSRSVQGQSTTQQETGFIARMSSALGMKGQSSTEQQENGSMVAKGMAAAGAVVGGAINSLREATTGEEQFSDQERWSEEADKPGRSSTSSPKKTLKRQGTADEFYSGAVEMPRQLSMTTRKRRTVAIVVSAVADGDTTEVGGHASILAHLPEYVNRETTRIFVLIYAPELQAHPLSAPARRPSRKPSQSMSSSFSNISQAEAHTPAHTPGDFPGENADDPGILSQVDPNPIDDSSSLYKTLHNQAMALVDRDNMIFPFTTLEGHKHILKSIQPELVYIQESLCGTEGEVVAELQGWVRQIVVVIGDEGGAGGLVDTDDEEGTGRKSSGPKGIVWWKLEERTGVGRGCSVVESIKIGEDWRRRVNEDD